MATDILTDVADLLTEWKVCLTSVADFDATCKAIVQAQLTKNELVTFYHELLLSCGGDKVKVGGLLMAALRNPQSVKQTVERISKLESKKAEVRKGGESSLRHASARNPYGWVNPVVMEHLDHDRPGEWNAYRQWDNLTKIPKGCTDYKIRGCTNGKFLQRGQKPTHYWDEAMVLEARRFSDKADKPTAEQVQAAMAADEKIERDIYGV